MYYHIYQHMHCHMLFPKIPTLYNRTWRGPHISVTSPLWKCWWSLEDFPATTCTSHALTSLSCSHYYMKLSTITFTMKVTSTASHLISDLFGLQSISLLYHHLSIHSYSTSMVFIVHYYSCQLLAPYPPYGKGWGNWWGIECQYFGSSCPTIGWDLVQMTHAQWEFIGKL
jgi:hypothetical protein